MTENNNGLDLDLLLQFDDESWEQTFTDCLLIKAWQLTQKYSENIYDRTDSNLIIADLYRETKREEIADKIVEHTLELNRQSDRNPFVARNYNLVANYYLKNNNRKRAIKILDLAFNLAQKIEDEDVDERDYVFIDIGESYGNARAHNIALECGELVEDSVRLAGHLYVPLIWEYIDTQQYQQTENVIDRAIESGWGDWVLEEAVKSYLALKDFNRAGGAIKRIEGEQSKVSALADMAQRYWQLDKQEKARETLAKAKAIANDIEDSTSKSWSLQAISKASRQMDIESKSTLQESVEEARNINNDFHLSFAVNSLAFQLASVGKYDEALEIMDRENVLMPVTEKIGLLINIAKQYRTKGELEKAEQMIETGISNIDKITGKKLSIPRAEIQAFAWGDIADYALEFQDYKLFNLVLDRIKSPSAKANLLLKISDIRIKNNETEAARKTLARATNIISNILVEANNDNLPGSTSIALSYLTTVVYYYTRLGDYNLALETVKSIPSNIERANSLIAIARQYNKTSKTLEITTFDILKTIN
ncbi:MAG: tetratricopeptide repeat protein [Pleurocapsa sp.]